MVHLVWIGGTGVLQSILSSLILKVYHAFAFKPITIKFVEFTNFWMPFQMMCPIFNSIDIKCSYQEKICSYPVPCSFRTWPIDLDSWVFLVVQCVRLLRSCLAQNAKLQELIFVAMPMTCQQFQRSQNLFGDCKAYGVWSTKSFFPMLLWPLRVLSYMFLASVMSDQRKHK